MLEKFLSRKDVPLSFVTPLAYDFRYAARAIEAYYPYADEIILGLDKDRVSWSGGKFEFDMAGFQDFLKRVDTQKKVALVEEDFHGQPTPMRNDTWERNQLSLRCKAPNWVVQIDADEIVLNPEELRDWLQNLRFSYNVLGSWLTVFKTFPGACLVINKREATISVATLKKGQYTGCRDTLEWKRKSPLKMLHFSWGRTPREVRQKLTNWTHSKDFDTDKFFELWQGVTLENYAQFKDIHPMDGPDWPSLRLVKKGDPEYAEIS
jgi:hypothetical protein